MLNASTHDTQLSKTQQPKPHVLLIDNFDSFSFNLVDALSVLGAHVDVCRNTVSIHDVETICQKKNTNLIVLSPGPGQPQNAGCIVPLIQTFAGRIPLLGICLGHQAIGYAFGANITSAQNIMHGKKSKIEHDGHPVFADLPSKFDVGRYHSLIVQNPPDELKIIAKCGSEIMAIAHKQMPVIGLQFHPESILTTQGHKILRNALNFALQASAEVRQ